MNIHLYRKSCFAAVVMLMFLLSSCASVNKLYNYGGKAPIFLHVTSEDLANTKFYINGEEVFTEMRLYRAVTEGNYTLTTSLPCIRVKPNKQYYTLTVKKGSETKNILLKRDYNKLWYGLNVYMTVQTGNI
ncbi:MAG: hypothetical protein ACXWD4_15400, partial [Bacteroidia bacterium]